MVVKENPDRKKNKKTMQNLLSNKVAFEVSCHWYLSIPPENIRKPQGGGERNHEMMA